MTDSTLSAGSSRPSFLARTAWRVGQAGLERPAGLSADLEAGFARFGDINRGHQAGTG